MKKNTKRWLTNCLIALLLCSLLCACGAKTDGGLTEADAEPAAEATEAPAQEPASEETEAPAPVDGTELSTSLWSVVYSDEWSYDTEYFTDEEDYADATLSIEDGDSTIVSVEIIASVEGTSSYRSSLKSLGIDAYELVENKSVPLVTLGGIDFVSAEGTYWGEDATTYLARVESAGATVTVRVTGDTGDSRVEPLLNSLGFTLPDSGNVDPPWPWNGTPLAPDSSYSAGVGSYTITSEWIPFAESVVVDDIFSGRIEAVGNSLWVLIDNTLYEYTIGDQLTLANTIELEDDYEEISADQSGNLYVSGFMAPMLRISNGAVAATYDDVDTVLIGADGTWGISYFTQNVLDKVELSGDTATVSSGWITIDNASVVSAADVTANYIFAMGSSVDKENHTVWGFDLSGSPLFELGNKEMEDPDWLGSVTQMIETENGFIGLDGNLRNICFWQKDGTFIGTLEDSDLFGTSYPWMSAATILPDGSVLVGLTEERPDESADEFVVYRLSGF